jgi:hypothetical protein
MPTIPSTSSPANLPQTPADSALLLTPREAAGRLAISERSLWGISAPRGPLPVVRIGKSVRYAVADLAAYVDRLRQEQAEAGEVRRGRPAALNGHAAE